MLKAREWPKTSQKQWSGTRLQPRRVMLKRSTTSVRASRATVAQRLRIVGAD
jgi:hypothetical protein